MTGLVILGNGFEVSEALVPCDLYFRAGIKTVKASVYNNKEVISQEGIKIVADTTLDEVDLSAFDFLFIPGGKASFTVLDKDERVSKIIKYFVDNNKLVTSICAAPFLIGRLGYFENRKYTCFPSFEQYVTKGTYLKEEGVVVDGNFITAKSVYYATPFALEVIKKLLGEEVSSKVLLQIKAEA